MTLCSSALKVDEVLAHIVVRVILLRLIRENASPLLLSPARFSGLCDCNAFLYCAASLEKVVVKTAAFNFAVDHN